MIVQKVNAERLVLLGWSRAILLQIAHPLVAAGVLDHSHFRGSALAAAARLHHTVGAMLSLVYGDPTRRLAALNAIRAIHRRVHGTLPTPVGPYPAGTAYSAEDPALLLWVHATLIDSVVEIYTRLVGPLTAAERDAICRDSAPLVADLGGDPATTPLTWSSLQHYFHGMLGSGRLAVSDEARRLGHTVLSPRAAGLPLPLGGSHRLLVSGLLPATIRDAYRLPWDARRERQFIRRMLLLRSIRRLTPSFAAHWRPARLAQTPPSGARSPGPLA